MRLAARGSPLRISFFIHDLKPSGGLKVVLGHAERLSTSGWDVQLVMTSGEPDTDHVDGVPLCGLASARGKPFDVAVATWWETASALYEVHADRRVVFLQSLEELFYRGAEQTDSLGAATVLTLPVDFIAVSGWIRDMLAELRPDARCRVVPNGVDKEIFAARAGTPRREGGPLRVLVDGQPDLWFKGVGDAMDVVSAMGAEHEVAFVSPNRNGSGPVFSGLSRENMANVYADADVLLKLSRVEGLGLGPLEAFHMGVPCMVTPYGGHSEYVRHGHNGLVVGFDDIVGAAHRLDLLASDSNLHERLSRGALETAKSWPSESSSTSMFQEALESLVEDSPPPLEPALRENLENIRLWVELTRQRFTSLHWELDWRAENLQQLRTTGPMRAATRARELLRRAGVRV